MTVKGAQMTLFRVLRALKEIGGRKSLILLARGNAVRWGDPDDELGCHCIRVICNGCYYIKLNQQRSVQ